MKKNLYALLILIIAVQLTDAQKLKVATYNIRNANKLDSINGNGWNQRCPVINQLILYNNFDIIGMQEVIDKQKNDLQKALPLYEHIGIGRDDGKTKGEYSSIFYKKERFTLLKSGNFWLSQNTDYPNKGWDAMYTRICTWVQLKDKNSNMKVWFFNVHMDHRGTEARCESSKLLLRKINEMCGKDPVILVGDFNSDQRSETYAILANSKILHDSYEISKTHYALNGTFNGFDPNYSSDIRIDHVFVSSAFTVDKYGILTDTYRSEITHSDNISKDSSSISISRIPSDHFPVSVEMSYNKYKK